MDPALTIAEPSAAVRPFAPLHDRRFRAYYVGLLVSSCGTQLQVAVQGWLVWELSHDATMLGVVAAMSYLPLLLLSWLGGWLADRHDRRLVLLGTQGTAALLALVLGCLALRPDLQVWHVAAVALALGIVNAIDLPTRHAFLLLLVDRPLLVSAVSLNAALFQGASLVGPALASVLVTIPWLGYSGCFFLNAASYGAVLAVLARMRVPGQKPEPADAPRHSALAGLHYAVRTPVIGLVIGLVVVAGIFGWSVPVILPVLTERVLGGGVRLNSLLNAAIGGGAISGALVLAWRGGDVQRRTLIFAGLTMWCAGLFALSLVRWPAAAFAALAAAGAGKILVTAPSNAVVQLAAPETLRGRVMAVWSMIFGVADPVGSLQIGLLASTLGPIAAIQLNAAVLAAAGLLAYLLLPAIDFPEGSLCDLPSFLRSSKPS